MNPSRLRPEQGITFAPHTREDGRNVSWSLVEKNLFDTFVTLCCMRRQALGRRLRSGPRTSGAVGGLAPSGSCSAREVRAT